MPLYTLQCVNGHVKDEFCHLHAEKGIHTHICLQCGHTMGYILSTGTPLTYFGEGGKGEWVHNLGHAPVFITSHKQLEREMKQRGLGWITPPRGMKGCWT